MNALHRAMLVTAVAAFLTTTAAHAQETVLSAINFLPNNHSFGILFADWVEDVNKAGKGLVQIQIRPAGSMSPFTMANAVKSGVVDIVALPPSFYPNLLPAGDVVKLARRSPQEIRKNGGWELLNQLHNERVNAWLLNTVGYSVNFHLYLRSKKLETPDLKGLKIRTSPTYRAFFTALGADLIQTAPGEVFIGLERGAIDGYGWTSWDLKTPGWDKHTKYRVDPGFYAAVSATLINLDKWKALTEQQRTFLTEQAIKFEGEFAQRYATRTAAYYKEQSDAGVQIIELKGEVASRYLKTAYDAAWAEFMQLDPVNTPLLRKLLAD